MISFGGAKHDVWLTAILLTFLGLIVVYLMIALGLRYPSQTIIQYSRQILGRWPGGLIGLLYITFFLLITTMSTRDFMELFLTYIMPETPIYALLVIALIMTAYAAINGLEVIARSAEILVPTIFLVVIAGTLGNIPNMNFNQLTPVLEDGWQAVTVDAITQLPYFGLAIFWLFILPSLNIKTGAKKTLLLSIVIAGLAVFLVSITVVVVLGAEAPLVTNYQFYNAFRNINLADFIERVDILFLLGWTSTSFVTITLFFYLTVASIQQWLSLESYRPLVLPAGAIIFILAILLFSSYAELRQFFSLERFGIIALPLELGIPIILLGVDYFKNKVT